MLNRISLNTSISIVLLLLLVGCNTVGQQIKLTDNIKPSEGNSLAIISLVEDGYTHNLTGALNWGNETWGVKMYYKRKDSSNSYYFPTYSAANRKSDFKEITGESGTVEILKLEPGEYLIYHMMIQGGIGLIGYYDIPFIIKRRIQEASATRGVP